MKSLRRTGVVTFPHPLSWLDPGSGLTVRAGCLLLGSATTPVQEVIRDGDNGLLVDFFDSEALARRLADVLACPQDFASLRERARQTIIERYDLKTVCLPQMLEFLRG